MSNVPFLFGGVPGVNHQQQQHQQQNGQAPILNGTAAPQQQQQQPVMPMAALPPQLLAALQGIAPEQLGAIFQAFQSGLIPMPPTNLAQTQPAPASASASSATNPAPSSHAHGTPSVINPDMDMNQEDGEIEDGEVDGASTPQTRGFLRTPPKGPRDNNSRRGSHQLQQQVQQATQPGLIPHASSSTLPKVMLPNGKAPLVPSTNSNFPVKPSKEAASKAFIREMHQAGYTYDDLARELKDTKMLRRMYEQMSLPTPSSRAANKANVADDAAEPARKQVPAKPAKSQPAPPKDRSEYLAKLQAAKAKKTEAAKGSVGVPVVPQSIQPPVNPPSQVPTVVPSAPSKAAIIAPSAPTQGAVRTPVPMSKEKTEELRRRLEAIKAKRAAEQSVKLSNDASHSSKPADAPSTGTSTPQQTAPPPSLGLGAGLIEAAARATRGEAKEPTLDVVRDAQAVNTSFPKPSSGTGSPLLNRAFGPPGLNLPGLFTSVAPHSAGPTSSPRPLTNGSASYAAPPVTPMNASGAGAAPTTRVTVDDATAQQATLGQRNNVRASEKCVIEVSSDEDAEDDEDDMDTDDSSEAEHVPSPAPAKGVVKAFSEPHNGASAPGTPNAYKRKLEEIEQFKQQIAEKEKRRKLANIPSAHPAEPLRPTNPTTHQSASVETRADDTDTTNRSTFEDPAPGIGPASVAPALPSPATVAATRLARAQEKEALQRRLKELDALRSKHDSGSPTLPRETTSTNDATMANLPALTKPTAPVIAADTDDVQDEVDDEDDEDLYGDATNNDTQEVEYQQGAQDTTMQSIVNSQPLTESDSQHGVAAVPSAHGAQSVPAHDALHQVMEVDRAPVEEAGASVQPESVQNRTNNDNDDDDEYDDEDLDDVYEPSTTATQAAPPRDPSVQATDGHQDSDDAMDTSAESSDSDSESDSEPEPGAASKETEHLPEQLSAADPKVSDDVEQQSNELDLAPELQPAEAELHLPTNSNDSAKHTRFTPYESGLRRFKDYRYHPEYTNTVPTGFKSLTYNHKIDPMKTVCPFELQNGQCDDINCGYQHFQEMNLLDNDLLRLMGTERTPARNAEEDQRWKEGLQNLVKELRTTNFGKDAGLIAQRIAEYRRSFVNDPTKVLLLDD